MNKKIVLCEKPIGYSTAKELWEQYAREKFAPLKSTQNVNDYYDYIFAAGVVGYWLAHEDREPKEDENYLIFNSVYNNTKHYVTDRKRRNVNVFVQKNDKLCGDTDGEGHVFWNDLDFWDDNTMWIEDCEGESDVMRLCCEIHDDDKNTDRYITLYEICKRVFYLYEQIFESEQNFI